MLTKNDIFLSVDYKKVAKYYYSFEWLDPEITQKEIVLITVFGDPIFTEPLEGVKILDLVTGKIEKIADSLQELQQISNTKNFQENVLLTNLIIALKEQKITRKDDEIYSFILPPILGGKVEIENVEASDFAVAISIAGQIHEQTKDLPEGTRITGFKELE